MADFLPETDLELRSWTQMASAKISSDPQAFKIDPATAEVIRRAGRAVR